MAQLAALLRTDLSRMAEEVRRAGRGRDTMLAHITPKEAALLKARGGRGSINPQTGLLEFEPEDEFEYSYLTQQPTADFTQPVNISNALIYNDPTNTNEPIPESGGATALTNAQGTRSFGQKLGAVDQILDTTPSYRPSMNYGKAMPRGSFNGLDIDQGFGARAPSQQIIEAAAAPQEKTDLQGLLGKAGDALKSPLGISALAGGIPSALLAAQARRGAAATQRELAALGQPIREAGQAKIAQAQAGQLTAAQQQSLEAQRLAAMQNLQRRGVTDATAMQQVENQLQAQKAKMIDDLLNQGYREIAQGNAYIERGMAAALQANAEGRKLLGSFATNYMQMLAKMGEQQQPYTTTTARPGKS